MKTLLLCMLFLAQYATAQNVAVRFTGANTNSTPQYWPSFIKGIGTNTSYAGLTVMPSETLDQIIRTNEATAVAATALQSALRKGAVLARATMVISNVVWAADSVEAGWTTNTAAQRLTGLRVLRRKIDTLEKAYAVLLRKIDETDEIE